jgi:hypothetical protein
MHVASVSCGCCKSRSGCCICCNGYTRMLQASVPNVSAVSDGCCTCFIWVLHMFYTYVASVLSRCCICFTLMLQVFHTDVVYVFNMCFPRVSNVCCKYFNCFRTYVANIFSRCCKNRSSVAHVVVDPICSSHLLQLLSPPACTCVRRGCELQCGKLCGRRSRRSRSGTQSAAGHGPNMGHGPSMGPNVKQACSAGVRMLAPSGRSGASLSQRFMTF